ncbi:hypothetical protein [Chryseobacterium sp. KMC2]|jgi:hypothetical protein|uniref:hypothetical protein n=1 Tax=Chryseobacterium sp. KMC2 TaxID=2800705 RepID=UPI001923EB52|nr:hypothetical protein [Chryseobacterium sp. KMC2]MBL3548688.1 hypothetical protein [Chryseobacterium sp. KMC2]
MKNILIFFSLFTISFSSAQIGPPPPSMPTKENEVLINELIKVTEFENYFNSYCKSRIELEAKNKNWDENKRNRIINSINYEKFTNTIYNVFSRDSKGELEEIITLFKKLNKKRNLLSTKLIISNLLMQENLEGYVETLLSEK